MFDVRVSQIGSTGGEGETIWAKWPKTAWKLQYQHFWVKAVGRTWGATSHFSWWKGFPSPPSPPPPLGGTLNVFIFFIRMPQTIKCHKTHFTLIKLVAYVLASTGNCTHQIDKTSWWAWWVNSERSLSALVSLKIFDINMASVYGAYWRNYTVFSNSQVSLIISCGRWNSLVSVQLHRKCLDGGAWCGQF